MKFQIITLNNEEKLEFYPGESLPITKYCQIKRDEKGSKCNSFYERLFLDYKNSKRDFTKCPYGLYCVGPIKWTERDRIASGFLIEGENCPAELAGQIETIKKDEVEEYLYDFDEIANEFHQQSYSYLESAIHDVRHLNSDITAHSERLLNERGYAENEEWDKTQLNKNETDKRILSVYCASRDISAALSMHEIAIDPKRASDEIIPTNIHKLFYRQKQINLEKLEKKRLNVQIENRNVSKNLTKSFSLIPIVLLNNAIKYSENSSTINIRFIETGSVLKIICSNSGPVVRKEELEAVFMKYRRGSNKTGISGHGIGLYLASIIIQENLGSIHMETEEKGMDNAMRKTGITSVIIRLI